MSLTDLPHNQVPSEPELRDLLDLLKRDIFLSFNCHAVAAIQSFNPVTQQATATINYKKARSQFNAATNAYAQTAIDYPQVVDAPVIFLGGGDAALTFPVESGDECLVLFHDRDLDNWFQGNQGAVPASTRAHAFGDAIILVGVRSLPSVLAPFDPDRTVLAQGQSARVAIDDDGVYVEYGPPLGAAQTLLTVDSDGVHAQVGPTMTLDLTSSGLEVDIGATVKVSVTSSSVTVQNGQVQHQLSASQHTLTNGTNTLGALLAQLTTQLQSLCTSLSTLVTQTAAVTVVCAAAGSPSSPPANAAAISAVSSQISAVNSQISTIATNLSGLLA